MSLRTRILPARAPLGAALLIGAGAALILSACLDDTVREQALHDGPVEPGEREWLPVDWDTVWAVGGADDELLHDPEYLRPHEDGLIVWDHGRHQVLAFDDGGELLWRFGQEGEGPDEFQQVMDLQVGSHGQTFVYDAANQRVTILSPEGSVDRRVGLADVPQSGTLAVPGDTLLAFVPYSSPEDPLRVLDLEGEEVLRGDFPWDGFADLTAISRQGRAHSLGDRWVYAFLLTNGWFGFEGVEPVEFIGGYVEHQDLPNVAQQTDGNERTQRLTERPRCTACSLSIADSLLAIHFGGHEDRAYRTLDLHQWDDGTYLGSWELPMNAGEAMVSGDRVYTLHTDPFPVISAFRMYASAEGEAEEG